MAFDSSRFAIPTTPPFEPGESPYRVAGVVYKSLIAFVGDQVPGGLERVVKEVRQPAISPEALTVGLARAVTIVQPFGGLHIESTRSREIRGQRTGVPHVLVHWLVLATGAFLETALERLGSPSARATFGDPTEDGQTGRQTTYTLPFEIAWS